MSKHVMNDVERVKAWLERPRIGCRNLQLVHEQAMSNGAVVLSFDNEEISADVEQCAQQILNAAQDHADAIGESCRFNLQWLGTTGRVKTSMILRVAQTPGTEEHEGASAAHAVSSNAIVGQLLQALDRKDRQMNAGMSAVFLSMERVLKIQNEMLERVAGQLREVSANAAPKPVELPEALANKLGREAELRTMALQKLVDIGPDIMKLAIGAGAKALGLLDEDDGDGSSDKGAMQ